MCETGSRTCLDSDFACSRSLCIPKAWVCDDSPDCPDARDELEAECKSKFLCHMPKKTQVLMTAHKQTHRLTDNFTRKKTLE
ncbi:Low-density lipoprotein receptor-related protein 8 [Orchesella cincta]|uniref:Low-density lipoprotein receptor-related protein 8 n=1 Tax=Orchesella cincta TaxID=48709 RepID=A0A1D2N1S3_ORCCI|nr:Low-density lipoprotein receptor-related protein 8 [Orchesella cincta]